jgi:hypothetical protein
LLNCYITRQEYLAWQTTQTPSTNVLDDAVIDSIIESVSRFIDDHTGRLFYPSMGTKVYDTPMGLPMGMRLLSVVLTISCTRLT